MNSPPLEHKRVSSCVSFCFSRSRKEKVMCILTFLVLGTCPLEKQLGRAKKLMRAWKKKKNQVTSVTNFLNDKFEMLRKSPWVGFKSQVTDHLKIYWFAISQIWFYNILWWESGPHLRGKSTAGWGLLGQEHLLLGSPVGQPLLDWWPACGLIIHPQVSIGWGVWCLRVVSEPSHTYLANFPTLRLDLYLLL